MATNESFEIGVQISSNPIFKMADRKAPFTLADSTTFAGNVLATIGDGGQ